MCSITNTRIHTSYTQVQRGMCPMHRYRAQCIIIKCCKFYITVARMRLMVVFDS